jgi:hypothetical protein
MTVASCVIVALIVWVISLVGSVRLRAFVYSLPIPMTLVLLLSPVTVDGAQVLGIVLLTLFFGVVALLHHRYRWNILLADAAGVAFYVTAGAGLARAGGWPLGPTTVVVVVAWTVANITTVLLSRRSEPHRSTMDGGAHSTVAKLAIALAGSLVTAVLGRALGGLVVTFPYAGVLVAVQSRADLPQFTQHFLRNSLSLVVFVAAFAQLQHLARGVAIAGAWAAFLACSLLLNLRQVRISRVDRTAI